MTPVSGWGWISENSGSKTILWGNLLVPLVDCMVMNQYRFDLYSAQETLVLDSAVVYVECDEGLLRCDVATENVQSAEKWQ
jgi:hypothetical protein